MKNLNLLFNKTYYRLLDTENTVRTHNHPSNFDRDCIANNRTIISTKFQPADFRSLDPLFGDKVQTLQMVTAYPGMLIGTGYAHGTAESDDDIKIGFSFDYVTGQPYIPGSSVKGILRSTFRNHPDLLASCLQEGFGRAIDLTALENELFEQGDIFLDAVVAKGSDRNNLAGGNLMDLDNITPHGEDSTKNPIPLRLLRIMPGVTFAFRFILSDGVLSKEEKIELFTVQLQLLGAGAKTNVGYGQLVPAAEWRDPGPSGESPSGSQTGGGTQSTGGQGGRQQNTGGQGGGRNNGYNNRSGQNNAKPAQTDPSQQKVKCPRCLKMSYVYDLKGKMRTSCSVCKDPIDIQKLLQQS